MLQDLEVVWENEKGNKHPFLSSWSSALCRCVGGPKAILRFKDSPEGLAELRKAAIFMVMGFFFYSERIQMKIQV